MHEPSDLIPLPTMPYDERPPSLPLDVEECRTAIWRTRGNIHDAAKLLKISSSRLRNFVKNSAYLTSEAMEAREILKDIAESNVYDALTDSEDPARRDSMSRFVLGSIGKDRGYGTGVQGGGKGTLNIGNISISWGDGTSISAEASGNGSPVLDGVAYKEETQ